MEHGLAGEESVDLQPVETADQDAVIPGLDAVRPAQLMELAIGGANTGLIQPPSRSAVAQAPMTASKSALVVTS